MNNIMYNRNNNVNDQMNINDMSNQINNNMNNNISNNMNNNNFINNPMTDNINFNQNMINNNFNNNVKSSDNNVNFNNNFNQIKNFNNNNFFFNKGNNNNMIGFNNGNQMFFNNNGFNDNLVKSSQNFICNMLNDFNNINNINMMHNNNCFNMMNSNPKNMNMNMNILMMNNFQKAINQNEKKYPHKTGLLNVGQSCYMNASLQCLSNIKEMSDFFLKKYGSFDIDKQEFTVAYSSLIYEIFNAKKQYISPDIFKQIIGELNPLFKGNQAADSKDLVFFIIERLHQELKPQEKQKIQNQPIDYGKLEIESQNEQLTYNKFIKEFKEKNTSQISNIFYGFIRSKMICYGCNKVKYSFQTFNLFNFILKKVKEDKIQLCGHNNYYNINIYDAFESERKEEQLLGENMIYCNFCHGLRNGAHQQNIYQFPSVLIIILNRGKNNQDFDEVFEFSETLDFSKSDYLINKHSFTQFFLCGIITHLGNSGSDGHFIAFCRNNFNEPFTCYNDASVSKTPVHEAMKTKISYNDVEKRTPYILFYHHL